MIALQWWPFWFSDIRICTGRSVGVSVDINPFEPHILARLNILAYSHTRILAYLHTHILTYSQTRILAIICIQLNCSNITLKTSYWRSYQMRNHYSNLAHAILKGGQLNVLQKGPTESSNFAATWPMLSGTTLGLVTTICPVLKVSFCSSSFWSRRYAGSPRWHLTIICRVIKMIVMKICREPRMTFVNKDDNALW